MINTGCSEPYSLANRNKSRTAKPFAHAEQHLVTYWLERTLKKWLVRESRWLAMILRNSSQAHGLYKK